MNRYNITDEVKDKYKLVVGGFIKVINEMTADEIANYNDDSIKLDLTGTELNPYTLGTILESLGYEKGEIDINGWEMDFWETYEKDSSENAHKLVIEGSGIIFELYLRFPTDED